MNKAQFRQEIKHRLAQLSLAQREEKSRTISDLILQSEPFQKAGVVMVFLSLPHEVETTAILLSAWQHGKTVAVPKVSWEQRHMIPVEISSLETGLEKDRMGLRHPTAGLPIPYEDIDMVITPGLGFDRQGNRLGRGGAYYDRFFASHNIAAAKWGVCFSEQVCPDVPHDRTDVPMDAVVTELGVIQCQ